METLLVVGLIALSLATVHFYSQHKKEKAVAHAASIMIAEILLDEGRQRWAKQSFDLGFDSHLTGLTGPEQSDQDWFWRSTATKALNAARAAAIAGRPSGSEYPDPDDAFDALVAFMRDKFAGENKRS